TWIANAYFVPPPEVLGALCAPLPRFDDGAFLLAQFHRRPGAARRAARIDQHDVHLDGTRPGAHGEVQHGGCARAAVLLVEAEQRVTVARDGHVHLHDLAG